MRHANGQLSFSATDLSRHLVCTHLTSLRRAVAFREIDPPPLYDDPRADVLRQRGIEHEQRLLDRFAEERRIVETIIPSETPFSHRDAAAAATRTREAMSRGANVIYQGRLEDDSGRWSGYPDFLLRVDRPSALGGWSYEVLDTKLARRAKGEALLQLLLYSDLLAQAQGIEPERMHLALDGGGSENPASFQVAEYAAYYRAVRRRFEAHAASPPDTYPEPVEHCGICEWQQSCAERRRTDDRFGPRSRATTGTTASRRCASPRGWKSAGASCRLSPDSPCRGRRSGRRNATGNRNRWSTAALFEALTAGLPVDDADLDGEQRARRLLAHLLEFHRREDKSMWWEFFHRCGFTEEEHVESRATLGALTYDGEVEQVKRSVVHRYRFPRAAAQD